MRSLVPSTRKLGSFVAALCVAALAVACDQQQPTGVTDDPGILLAKGGIKKAERGNLQEGALVYAWQSHSYPDGTNDAGAIILATGNIESIGKVDTELSMAYTWDFYGHNENALMYGHDQAGAPTELDDVKDYTPHEDFFDITYTFTATTKNGDELVLDIVHGVVHEGPDNDIDGTTNEWLIGLEVNGEESTGKFAGESGTGHIRLVVDSSNVPNILGSKKYVSAYEIYLQLGEVLVVAPVE